MRAVRTSVAIVLALTLMATGVLAADRDAQRTGFREAIALEKEAADLIPFDFDTAKSKLDEAALKLDGIDASGDLSELANDAAVFDRAAIDTIDEITADNQVTEEEMEALNWLLRQAGAFKAEGLQLISFIEGIGRMIDKKRAAATQVQAPRCQSGDQQVGVQSSCFTLDIWKINIDKGARAALCKIVDGSGDRLTQLRPLFDDVIQETTCRLTDKTVIVHGVEKRVVRATLKLSTLSRFNPSGTANVVVSALWR